MLFSKRVEINKINKAKCQLIAMTKIHCLAKVIQIFFVRHAVNVFIITKKIFPSEYKTAAQAKIPCKECIEIKKVHILILVGNKCTGNILSIFINVCKPLISYFAPVMSYPHCQIHSWCKIVNTRIDRGNIIKVDKTYYRLSI